MTTWWRRRWPTSKTASPTWTPTTDISNLFETTRPRALLGAGPKRSAGSKVDAGIHHVAKRRVEPQFHAIEHVHLEVQRQSGSRLDDRVRARRAALAVFADGPKRAAGRGLHHRAHAEAIAVAGIVVGVEIIQLGGGEAVAAQQLDGAAGHHTLAARCDASRAQHVQKRRIVVHGAQH